MRRQIIAAGLMMATVACGAPVATSAGRQLTLPSPSAVASAPPVPRPLPIPSSRPAPPSKCGFTPTASAANLPSALPPADAYVLATVYTNGSETLHLLAVNGGSVTDKPLTDHADTLLMDARGGIALVSTANASTLATLDLRTGAMRTIGSSDGCGFGGILSPDGTRVALVFRNADDSFEIGILDLRSAALRPLLRTGRDEYFRAGLVPRSWLPSGILVTPGVWDGPSQGLMTLNPDTGALSNLTDAQVDRLSSDGRLVAAAGHVDLGDGPFNGQGWWPNHLVLGPVGTSPTVVASQKDRAFYALDLENDGTLLYAKDDAPLSTATPAPDTGLYLYRNGASYQQFGEQLVTQWESVAIVGQNLALVGRQAVPGANGAVEFDLATLCATSGCHATSKSVLTVTGDYPMAYLLPVRQ